MRGNAGFYRSYFHYKNVQVRISGPVCTLKKRVISNQKHAENENKFKGPQNTGRSLFL